MTTPPELLEQALEIHGDTLYRVALLIVGDERAVPGLLRTTIATFLNPQPSPPGPEPSSRIAHPASFDEPTLLAHLVATARNEAERQRSPARRTRPASGPPLYRSLLGRPLDQRLALGLHLLLGYDGPRLALVLATDEATARATLIDAARALGPAVGTALTDRTSDEFCLDVRNILADPAAGSRHSAAVRGHLAGCALCRSFDHAWAKILQSVEIDLRELLRDRTLPPTLYTKLIEQARPPGRRRAVAAMRLSRFFLPPLAVLALIAVLVLPGFLRQPTSVVEREQGAPIDAQALIVQALTRHTTPPDHSGLWHARYETLWFFDDDVYAPLEAEVWLDSRNPARHRLQLTHRDGGAPYELQIGDGERQFFYALDAAYAPALYGSLPTLARPGRPVLLTDRLDPSDQQQARDARLLSGPWSLPPAYLRQAQNAPDLRLLGRQREHGRVVQILSFSGVSPLGLPPDAPGATAERVTVLLAIDSEDGLLRAATELAGPPGGTQTSRVTWRLVEENRLFNDNQIRATLSANEAWTGVGEFSEVGRHESADPTLPIFGAAGVIDPAALVTGWVPPLWLPSTPPPGSERALLIGVFGLSDNPGGTFTGAAYLGHYRRLLISFGPGRARADGEAIQVGPWRGTLKAGRTQMYRAVLERPIDQERASLFGTDPSSQLTLEAQGYTRAELLQVIEGMRPFDLDSLQAQDHLFARPAWGETAARRAILDAVLTEIGHTTEPVRYLRVRAFSRQDPTPPRLRDPYHRPPYDGRPPRTVLTNWLVPGAKQRLEVSSDPASGALLYTNYVDPSQSWYHMHTASSTVLFSSNGYPVYTSLPTPIRATLELLAQADARFGLPPNSGVVPAKQLHLEEHADGTRTVIRSEPARGGRYDYLLQSSDDLEPYLFDLRPITMTTELDLDASGRFTALRLYADPGLPSVSPERQLVASYELEERGTMTLAEAPATLREATPPQALFSRDYRAGAVQPVTTLTRIPIETAIARAESPFFVLTSRELRLAAVEGTTSDRDEPFTGYNDDLFAEAVASGLAFRLRYEFPSVRTGLRPLELTITQGPADPLRSFLQTTWLVPWRSSEPVRLTLAGREVDAWLGQGSQTYVLAELDGTLLIITAPTTLDQPRLLALLAGLRPAEA